jgi:hypothetical protein
MKFVHQTSGLPASRGTLERRRHLRGSPEGGPSRSDLIAMIVGSYREMPGLSLHLNQAARLFDLRPSTCRVVLDHLVTAGRLRRTADGQYASTP